MDNQTMTPEMEQELKQLKKLKKLRKQMRKKKKSRRNEWTFGVVREGRNLTFRF